MHFFDLKQNGHPVSPNCICFDREEKTDTKEACDVRTDYSILLPLSSNQNYRSKSNLAMGLGLKVKYKKREGQ